VLTGVINESAFVEVLDVAEATAVAALDAAEAAAAIELPGANCLMFCR
jgi:hypothetical protein